MNTMKRNIDEAIRELTARPMFAVSVERVEILNRIRSLYGELPQPLRFSKFMSVLLSEVSTPIEEYDLIAGRCVFGQLDEEGEKLFGDFLRSSDCPYRYVFIGSGHCTYSWELVVEEGLVGMRRIAEEGLLKLGEDEREKKDFLRSAIEIYDDMIVNNFYYGLGTDVLSGDRDAVVSWEKNADTMHTKIEATI